MSTVDKLNKVLETKEAIKQAIIDKGGTVGDVFAEYPTAIQNIQSGSGTFVVPEGIMFGHTQLTEFPADWDWSEWANGGNFNSSFRWASIRKFPKITITNKTTNTSEMFAFSSLEEIDMGDWDLSNVTNMENMFDDSNLKIVNWGAFDTRSNKSFREMFGNCDHLTTIPALDCSSNTSTFTRYSHSPITGCSSLVNFGGFIGINTTIYCENSPNLSYESVLNILNGLATGVSGQTVYLHQNNVNLLSDDDIAIATNKGWTISPARTV